MPMSTTFMSRPTFENFAALRRELVAEFKPASKAHPGPSHICVPWAGSRLAEKRGIYYLGISLAAEIPDYNEPNFDDAIKKTVEFCDNRRHPRANTPFWRFLDKLTVNLLGGPFHETSDRWGWSNLLKISWSNGSPNSWPPKFVRSQRHACQAALREEFEKFRQSLIFIGSYSEFDILWPVMGDQNKWNKNEYKDEGIWWLRDEATGNLYVHGYHPSAAQQGRFLNPMLDATLTLARTHLAPF
jgi:hypothetical protein